MTVTINTLGTNSRQIVIDSETSATNIIDAVNTSLTALGWTLIDTVTSGSRGLLTTKVYSAPNADTVTTKYMIIRYDLHRQYWFTSCCESWNTGTNVATNECWYGGRQILLPLQYSNCTLYVFATARYACFMGVVSSEPSAWQGVFEFERVAAEDIAAKTTPCFGWTSSLTIGEPYGNITVPASSTSGVTSNSNGTVAIGFAVPRTVNSLTGTAAAGVFNIMTSLGSFPPNKGQIGADWNGGGITQTLNSHTNMLGTWGDSSTYVWDTNKIPISNLKLNGYSSLYLVGRIYGLKITAKLGLILDTTTVPVDANLFYSAAGSNTTHYLLGIHGGYSDKLTSGGSNRLTATATTSVTAFGNPWQSVFVSGRFLYFTTSTGFHKYDTQTQGFTFNVLPAAAYYAVKFDGENSLYVTGATANTLYKINLSDDTYTSLSMTGQLVALAIDDTNLYVGSSPAGSTITIKRVVLSTFTEAETFTVTTGNAINYVSHLTTADYAGNLYVGTFGTASFTACRITKIIISSGSQSSLTPTFNSHSGYGISYGQPLFFDGTYVWMITNVVYNGINGTNISVFKIRLSDFTLTNFGSAEGPANTAPFSTALQGIGCLEPISFAGNFYLPVSAGTSSSYKLVFSDPRIDILSNALPNSLQAFDTNNITAGQYSTDQCSLYVMSGTTKIVRYTNAFRTYNFNGVQTSNLLIAQ